MRKAQNVAIEYRWADNQPDRLPGHGGRSGARDTSRSLSRRSPAPDSIAAKAATTTVPIVFTIPKTP